MYYFYTTISVFQNYYYFQLNYRKIIRSKPSETFPFCIFIYQKTKYRPRQVIMAEQPLDGFFQQKLWPLIKIYHYSKLILSMEKFVDGHLKTEIKQLISMQTLLEEYDRENKYLNKQVLQLLEENKSLKIDKIKHNIVSQFTDFSKSRQKNKGSKQNNHLPKTSWKDKKPSQNINGVTKQLKDEGIQVTARLNELGLSQLKEKPFQKQNSSESFSFGSPTGRISIAEPAIQYQSRRQSPIMKKQTLINSPQKIMLSTDHKQPQRIDLLRSPIQHFHQNEKSKLQQQSTELISFEHHEFQKKMSRSSSCLLKCKKNSKSTHAIVPSRKIEPSKSSKNLSEIEGHTQMHRASSHSYLRGQSGERRKKFINLVSSKQKKIIWEELTSERNLGC